MARSARWLAAVLSAASIAVAAAPGAAAPPEPLAAASPSILLLPTAVDQADLAPLAQALDALLADTAQDLGLTVLAPPLAPRAPRGESDLPARARAARALVVLPTLRSTASGDVELRLSLAAPGPSALEVRTALVARADLSLRAVVLLRALVAGHDRAAAKPFAPAPPEPKRSLAGRVTLMSNATALGGLVGYSVERASGSTAPYLLYPLLLAGAGIGLGASYLASEEWEVGTGDAWYFAAGAWWPTLAGHLIFQGRFAATRADSDRWVFGLLGGGLGATIATLGLALHTPMSDGDAAIAHSGGGLGLLLGALVEAGARGDVHQVPFSGLGYGAGLGWLGAAALATQLHVDPLRVVAVDGGFALGGLAGAALASPLLLGGAGADRQRAWVGVTAGSAVAGAAALGALGARLTGPRRPETRSAGMPIFGVIGESQAGAKSAPILGLGYAGSIEGIRRPFPR